jgi:hypothetical protein
MPQYAQTIQATQVQRPLNNTILYNQQPQMQTQMQTHMQPQMQTRMQPQMQTHMQPHMRPHMQTHMQPHMQTHMQPHMQPHMHQGFSQHNNQAAPIKPNVFKTVVQQNVLNAQSALPSHGEGYFGLLQSLNNSVQPMDNPNQNNTANMSSNSASPLSNNLFIQLPSSQTRVYKGSASAPPLVQELENNGSATLLFNNLFGPLPLSQTRVYKGPVYVSSGSASPKEIQVGGLSYRKKNQKRTQKEPKKNPKRTQKEPKKNPKRTQKEPKKNPKRTQKEPKKLR